MEDLFKLQPEKYWRNNKKGLSKAQQREIIERKINSGKYIASVKKDGHYNRFVKQNGEIRMQSRNVSTVTGEYSDKKDNVPHIVEDLKNLPDNTVIIGEVYYRKNSSSARVQEILGCLPEEAVIRQKNSDEKLCYYIHDIWYYNGESLLNTPYEKRIEKLQEAYRKYIPFRFGYDKNIILARYATTPQGIKEMLTDAFNTNEEGIVMVLKDSKVDPGKRTSWKTIKVKKELEQEIDAFFTGEYKQPNRIYDGKSLEHWLLWYDIEKDEQMVGEYYKRYKKEDNIMPVTKAWFFGWAGSAQVALYKDGKIVELGYVSGISDEIKEGLVINNSEYVNRPCVLTAMEFTPDNKLRHPKFLRFRDDIPYTDCTWDKVFD